MKQDYTQKNRIDCQTSLTSAEQNTGSKLDRLQTEIKRKISQAPLSAEWFLLSSEGTEDGI